MSRNSRSYAGAVLVAAWVSIPAMGQAQTISGERGLINVVGSSFKGQFGEHQVAATRNTSDQLQASRALLGTVGAIQFDALETGTASSGFPTPALALLGQPARPKTGKQN